MTPDRRRCNRWLVRASAYKDIGINRAAPWSLVLSTQIWLGRSLALPLTKIWFGRSLALPFETDYY